MKRRRPVAIPAFIQRGIMRTERERRASIIARPMRAMFDMLESGEVHDIDGHAVMRLPEFGEKDAEWCAIAPAVRGWIDCWKRIAPDLAAYRLEVLADRLEQDKPITPRLVEQARAEFEAHIARIPDVPPGKIESAITTAKIAWEFEKVKIDPSRTGDPASAGAKPLAG